MIRIRVYWDGFYQGEFDSTVRIEKDDTIYGALFQNIITGEKFKVIVAPKLEVHLHPEWKLGTTTALIYQNVNVMRLE
jgi:hypothetical protein